MPKFLQSTLFLIVITIMVWTSTLWRWRTNAVSPSLFDVLVYLIVAPLCLTAVLMLLIWQGTKIRQALEAPIGSQPHLPASPGRAVAADETAAQSENG